MTRLTVSLGFLLVLAALAPAQDRSGADDERDERLAICGLVGTPTRADSSMRCSKLSRATISRMCARCLAAARTCGSDTLRRALESGYRGHDRLPVNDTDPALIGGHSNTARQECTASARSAPAKDRARTRRGVAPRARLPPKMPIVYGTMNENVRSSLTALILSCDQSM
jgi:hypothetical protein